MYDSMTNGQTPSTDEGHVRQSKATEELLNGPLKMCASVFSLVSPHSRQLRSELDKSSGYLPKLQSFYQQIQFFCFFAELQERESKKKREVCTKKTDIHSTCLLQTAEASHHLQINILHRTRTVGPPSLTLEGVRNGDELKVCVTLMQ